MTYPHKFLLVLIIFSWSVFAFSKNPDIGLFYAIDDINRGVTKFTPPLQCLTDPQMKEFEVAAEDMKYRQQCALALCGSPSVVPSVYVDKKNVSRYLTPAISKRLEVLKPKLRSALENIKEEKKRTLAVAEKEMLSSDGKLNFNPQKWTGTDALLDINQRTFDQYLQMHIDRNAQPGKRISYKIIDVKAVPANIIAGLNDYKEQLAKYKNSNPDTILKYDLVNETEARKLLREQIAQHEALLKRDAKNNNIRKLDEIVLAQKALDRLKTFANSPVNNVREFVLNSVNDQYDFDNAYSKINPNYVSGIFQTACMTTNCTKAYQAFFQSIDANKIITNYKKSLDDPAMISRSTTRCVANMIASESNDSSQARAKKLVAEVVPAVLKNFIDGYSEGTKKYYREYFAKELEVSSKRFSRSLDIEGFSLPLEKYDRLLSEAASEPMKKDFDEVTFLKEIIRHSEGDIPNPLADSNFCNDDPIANAWDSFISVDRAAYFQKLFGDSGYPIPKKDTVYVSPFSCNHATQGKSHVAHELGHAISSGFLNKKASSHSSQIFLKLRECISQNHSNGRKAIENEEINFPGDYMKTEEDTADAVAFSAYKNESQLSSCSLLKQDENNTKFLDLYVAEDDGESSHSNSFYRLMMEAINKGIALPPSCQVVVEKSKGLIGFKKCIE